MRRIPLSDLRPGEVLSRAIYGASGALLLSPGKEVTQRFLVSLTNWGITAVYVDDAPGQDKSDLPEPVRATYRDAISRIGQLMEDARRGSRITLTDAGRELGDYTLQLAAEPNVLEYLRLLREQDNYTFHHSINVGIVATLLARWLELGPDEQAQLAMAGTLHDLGKASLPLEILLKPGRLTPDEFAIVQRHPIAGYELLTAEFSPESVPARAALEHHERTDGSGYPNGLRAQDTALASRIVAVADVYDAMTSNRVYHTRQPEFAVLAQLQGDSFGLLDPQVVGVFVRHAFHLSQGRRVKLNNGQIGRVLFVYEQDPTRPVVEVGPELIDLTRRHDLSLVGEVDE